MALFPADTARWRDHDLEERWSRLLEVRRTVYGALETARNAKTIGASLTAHVTISASGETFDLLERHEADLPMLFIVSSVSLEPRDAAVNLEPRDAAVNLEPRDAAVNLERRGAAGSSGIVHVDVSRASGDKCPRCWRFVSDAATTGDLAGLCSRCVAALGGNPVAATR